MEIRDIHSLLEQYLSEGFTIESLTQATGVSSELISKINTNQQLTLAECKALNIVLYFLIQLYGCNTQDISYLKDIVVTINDYFLIPSETIANYLKLTTKQFQEFIDNPEYYKNGYYLTIRLLHLFTTLVRTKNNK